MAKEPSQYVTYYTCNCDYLSKYCDEHHLSGALVPVSILEQYRIDSGEGRV